MKVSLVRALVCQPLRALAVARPSKTTAPRPGMAAETPSPSIGLPAESRRPGSDSTNFMTEATPPGPALAQNVFSTAAKSQRQSPWGGGGGFCPARDGEDACWRLDGPALIRSTTRAFCRDRRRSRAPVESLAGINGRERPSVLFRSKPSDVLIEFGTLATKINIAQTGPASSPPPISLSQHKNTGDSTRTLKTYNGNTQTSPG